MQNGLCLEELDADETETVSIFKEVVVIGNGPSAISVSYILSGHWPYYKGNGHSVEFLHYRLMEQKEVSLVEQDLNFLCEGLEGRSSNPVSVLFDLLNHPDADLGLQLPSTLQWLYHSDKAFDHVVIGRGKPGGSWQGMEGSTLTISLGNWMELPNLSYKEWEAHMQKDKISANCIKQNRATVRSVAQYYSDYVHLQKLRNYFRNKSEVTRVTPLSDSNDTNWKVEGYQYDNGRKIRFSYITPNVVLATGSYDLPNCLDVAGEELPFVLHSLSQLEWLISTKRISSESDPILIVGAGLSAADAVIAAHFYGISCIHVFRRSVTDKNLIFNKLPGNMYPEYHKVHQMMQGKGVGYQGYQPIPSHRVVNIASNNKVQLQGPSSCMSIYVSYVVVLVGSLPDLSFLPETGRHLAVHPDRVINGRDNTIKIDMLTHETISAPGVYALGPIVGDNFVSYNVYCHVHADCPYPDTRNGHCLVFYLELPIQNRIDVIHSKVLHKFEAQQNIHCDHIIKQYQIKKVA
uniref:FAD/NAD(P)-binding domain-containing protein n=1 Tax=Strigamia maritima TaxID=126957 RepID=T1J4X7_STRMM